MIRVLHLVGSAVDNLYADLSRLYATDCLTATADPATYEPIIAHVSPGGAWRFPDDLSDACVTTSPPLSLAAALAELEGQTIDVALPQMFCRRGMTSYRSLLDLLDIPFVGNRPSVMAIGADKALARAAVAAAGVDVPTGEVIGRGAAPTLVPPVVVKPADADNSLGVGLVEEASDYPDALTAAFAHADRVLVERYIPPGREVRCGTLEVDGRITVLPLEEYDVATRPIRSVEDKLRRDGSGGLHLVAKDPTRAWIVDSDDPVTAAVGEAARACHRALGCRHYGLFDFRIDPAGRPWFLEAGLYCSFARQSVIATMAEAAGTALPDLFATMVAQAVRSPT